MKGGEDFGLAWGRLLHHWSNAQLHWTDATHHKFESEFWQGLQIAEEGARESLERLEKVIAQARREVP